MWKNLTAKKRLTIGDHGSFYECSRYSCNVISLATCIGSSGLHFPVRCKTFIWTKKNLIACVVIDSLSVGSISPFISELFFSSYLSICLSICRLILPKPVKTVNVLSPLFPVLCYFIFPPVWPDWTIFGTLGNHSKPVATIILPKLPTLLGNFCKGVKIIHFPSEIIFGQLL